MICTLGKSYDDIRGLTYTPDSKQVIYIAKSGYKKFLVVNGEEQQWAYGIFPNSLTTSPDSKHIAYVATAGYVGALGSSFVSTRW